MKGKKSRLRVMSTSSVRCLLDILVEKLSRQFRGTRLEFTAEIRVVYIYSGVIRIRMAFKAME